MGWFQGKGSAKAPFLVSMKWSWGYRGQQERSPDRGSIERSIVQGSVQVERHISKPCERVQGGAIAP